MFTFNDLCLMATVNPGYILQINDIVLANYLLTNPYNCSRNKVEPVLCY